MIKLFKIEIDSNRIFGLDILRAFAISFVIYKHAANYVPSSVKHYFFFSQNIISPHPWFFPEAWSLSIEEWFYVIIPICLFIGIIILKLDAKKQENQSLIMILNKLNVTIHRYLWIINFNLFNSKSSTTRSSISKVVYFTIIY